MNPRVNIIGSGLAGSEAAYFLASRGVDVHIFEMRPKKMTEAHQTGSSAELVCSNSLKSKDPLSGPGILKYEMNTIGSLILDSAEKASIPGGQALTVDREVFSKEVTKKLLNHPNITFHHDEVTEPEESVVTLIATGPLTSEKLSHWIARSTQKEDLYFYDAIAPIIDASSIDLNKAFLANRNDKGGEAAYLNCPFTKDEYQTFIDALLKAEKVPPKNFEKVKYFQGCQPIEAIAESGADSLRFGPMRPVGLVNPHSDEKPYAVVQLRAENQSKTAYNLVGFQTKLKYGEQQKVFRLIPGLENAEFLRLGSVHRNTYVCGPKVFQPDLSLKKHPLVYLAGQITGVEGYLESAACGLLASLFILQRVFQLPHNAPPANTALGSILRHITASSEKNFQPANVHFGLFEYSFYEGLQKLKKDQIRIQIAKQSNENFSRWWKALDLPVVDSVSHTRHHDTSLKEKSSSY